MAQALLIPSLGTGVSSYTSSAPVSPLERIRDTFQPTEAPVEVYGHTYFHGKDDTVYPGLRQVTVQPGDTMYGVLLRQGFKGREITYRNLIEVAAQINGMDSSTVLRIGQNIIVPTREFIESQGAL